MKAAQTYREVIARFPSKVTLAHAIGKPESTCRSWYSRDSIPPEFFDLIGAAAKELGVPVSARQLRAIFDRRNQEKLVNQMES